VSVGVGVTAFVFVDFLSYILCIQQQPAPDGSFGDKDFFNSRMKMPVPPARSATGDEYGEGGEFVNQFIFDNNLEKFDILETSRLKSLIIKDENDLLGPLDRIQVRILYAFVLCIVYQSIFNLTHSFFNELLGGFPIHPFCHLWS
jgi:hypothetical protein